MLTVLLSRFPRRAATPFAGVLGEVKHSLTMRQRSLNLTMGQRSLNIITMHGAAQPNKIQTGVKCSKIRLRQLRRSRVKSYE